jgi:DNA-binding NarL/FixJ family response regulator
VRILWVENHATFARLAGRQFLADHDLTVVPAVAAAKAVLVERVFDVALVDYDLDDDKGTALVEFVRRHPKQMAVIAVSSHDEGNVALLAAGADAACLKTRFAEIGSVLRAVAGTEAARAELERG